MQDLEDLSQAVVNKLNGTKPGTSWMYKFEEDFRKQFQLEAPRNIPDCVEMVECSLKDYFETVVHKTAGVPIENILCKFMFRLLSSRKSFPNPECCKQSRSVYSSL